MSANEPECILVVDDNHIFRETLARRLRDSAYNVVTAETGERAFLALRDLSRPVDWLYTRADLPGLVDGWILADEYHDSHAHRPTVIAASDARISWQGDIILQQPSVTTVLDVLRHAIELERPKQAAAFSDADDHLRAA